MKDKRIIAMFITSAVALVASVVITLGIALTLADPIPVTFVQTCEFNYGSENASEVTVNGNVLVYEDAFVYQPTGSLVVNDWDADSDTCDAPIFPLKNQDFGTELQVEETVANEIKIAYVKVNNDTDAAITVSLGAEFDRDCELGKYTIVVIFDYATGYFYTVSNQTFEIAADSASEFAVILYTDTTDKLDSNELTFGEDKVDVNIVVTKY